MANKEGDKQFFLIISSWTFHKNNIHISTDKATETFDIKHILYWSVNER